MFTTEFNYIFHVHSPDYLNELYNLCSECCPFTFLVTQNDANLQFMHEHGSIR